MDLKDRLALVRLNNKYKSFEGIKSFRIASIDELTKNERNIIHSINKVSNKATDKISLNSDYSRYISWAKEKIMPFVSNDSEIIIIDGYNLAFLMIKDIQIFLECYFEKKESFSIYILNRELKKIIAIFKGEYFLEYYNRDI